MATEEISILIAVIGTTYSIMKSNNELKKSEGRSEQSTRFIEDQLIEIKQRQQSFEKTIISNVNEIDNKTSESIAILQSSITNKIDKLTEHTSECFSQMQKEFHNLQLETVKHKNNKRWFKY